MASKKKGSKRIRENLVAFWISTEEKKKLSAALSRVRKRSGQKETLSTILRRVVSRFCDDVLSSVEFE